MPIRKRLKRILFSLVPLFVLILVAEVSFRVAGLGDSPLTSPALPGEDCGLYRHDPELFWSMRPNVRIPFQGVTVSTNELGLRGGPVRPKKVDGFRILSVGESTTFGAGVENDETYSARLEQILNRGSATNRFEVINAGVSAYTSFQSLVYLKDRGFDLSPDLVTVYHEYNDFLPTYLRDSQNNVIGMNLSDRERHRSRHRRFHRGLMQISAVYRYLCYRVALSRIREFGTDRAEELSANVPVLVGSREEEIKMPVRVRPEERAEILAELIEECRKRRVRLVFIHPSYRETPRHLCILTDVCERSRALMFDAHPVLHPPGEPADRMFSDLIHPTALGHKRLAAALARYLTDRRLLPPRPGK